MNTPSQPPNHFTLAQAGVHAERILQLVQAQDLPGLITYLNEHLPQDKWDMMVFIYSRSRELQATIFRGHVTITGFRQSPTQATISGLAAVLLA